MIEINLLPDVKQEFIRAKRTRNAVISISMISGLAAGGLVVLMLTMLGVQVGREGLADNDIKDEYAKLSSIPDLSELLTLQSQLNSIGGQHDNKTITSRVFSILETVNPKGDQAVGYNAIRVSPKDSTVFIEGTAPSGYGSVEALVKTITNTEVEYKNGDELIKEPLSTSVVVGETSLRDRTDGGKAVSFMMTITVSDLVLSNQAKELRILGPDGRIDVTDSRIGVPERLFMPATTEDKDE